VLCSLAGNGGGRRDQTRPVARARRWVLPVSRRACLATSGQTFGLLLGFMTSDRGTRVATRCLRGLPTIPGSESRGPSCSCSRVRLGIHLQTVDEIRFMGVDAARTICRHYTGEIAVGVRRGVSHEEGKAAVGSATPLLDQFRSSQVL
jgi:hypothetical protein